MSAADGPGTDPPPGDDSGDAQGAADRSEERLWPPRPRGLPPVRVRPGLPGGAGSGGEPAGHRPPGEQPAEPRTRGEEAGARSAGPPRSQSAARDAGSRVEELFARAVEQQVAEERVTNRHLREITESLSALRARLDELGDRPGGTADGAGRTQQVERAFSELRHHVSAQSVAVRAELQTAVEGVRGELDAAVRGLRADLDGTLDALRAEVADALASLGADVRHSLGAVHEDIRQVVEHSAERERGHGGRGTAADDTGVDPEAVAATVADRVGERVASALRDELEVRLGRLEERMDERLGAGIGPVWDPGERLEERLDEVAEHLDRLARRLDALGAVRGEFEQAVERLVDPVGTLQEASAHLAHLDTVLVDYLDMREQRVRRERDAVLRAVVDRLVEGLSDRQRQRLAGRLADLPQAPAPARPPQASQPPRASQSQQAEPAATWRATSAPQPPGSGAEWGGAGSAPQRSGSGAAAPWRPAAAWRPPHLAPTASPAAQTAPPQRPGAGAGGSSPAATGDEPASGGDPEARPGHVCEVCGFVAKSAGGLGSHRRVHR